MAKIRSLTIDRAATEYLVGLCRIARDFQIDKNSEYANKYAYMDGFWIERLREQAHQASEWHRRINKFRINRAMSTFGSEASWLTDVKLGLADNLVAIQSVTLNYDMLASNHFQLKMSIGAETCRRQYPLAGRQYIKYAAERHDIGERIVYDNLLADIIGIYRGTERGLETLHRDVMCKAYMEMALRKLERSREQIREGTYLLPYVRLRQIIKPVRRLSDTESFQYRLMAIEESVNQRIAVLDKSLSEADVAYVNALHEQNEAQRA